MVSVKKNYHYFKKRYPEKISGYVPDIDDVNATAAELRQTEMRPISF